MTIVLISREWENIAKTHSSWSSHIALKRGNENRAEYSFWAGEGSVRAEQGVPCRAEGESRAVLPRLGFMKGEQWQTAVHVHRWLFLQCTKSKKGLRFHLIQCPHFAKWLARAVKPRFQGSCLPGGYFPLLWVGHFTTQVKTHSFCLLAAYSLKCLFPRKRRCVGEWINTKMKKDAWF